MSRRLRPLAAIALVALIGSGCSNASSESGDASGKHGTDQNEGVAFAECMRDNGVSEFPDPDPSGGLTVDGVLNGSSLDPGSPTWKEAIRACKDLQPTGFTGDEKVTPEEREVRLEFARCIRENGVEDFPDPADGEPLVDTNRIPSSASSGGMSILHAAMQECRGLAEQAGARR